MKRIVYMKVLPGEPLDGSGRVCIHLFVGDESGLFVEAGTASVKSMRGRLACDPKRDPASVKVGNTITVTARTDDPRAVTCPKCEASRDYVEMMAQLEQAQEN